MPQVKIYESPLAKAAREVHEAREAYNGTAASEIKLMMAQSAFRTAMRDVQAEKKRARDTYGEPDHTDPEIEPLIRQEQRMILARELAAMTGARLGTVLLRTRKAAESKIKG